MIRTFRRRLLDRFVLRPSRHELEYAPKQRLRLTVDGITDEYFVQHSADRDAATDPDAVPDLLVIKFPGTAGRAERATNWPLELLPDVSAMVYTWNAPGYGGSSGRATLSNIARRAARFWDLMMDRFPTPPNRIWLAGNSLGCTTATYLASRNSAQVHGMILRNPPLLVPTVKRVARRFPLGHLTDAIAESVPAEMDLALTAPKAKVPTVLLQSEQDKLVPPELQNQVFDALPGPKRLVVLDGLDHDGIATDEHLDHIHDAVQWLWQLPANRSTE